ncbi:Zn(II)Cys6 transcriptional activator [Fusarium pseudoanthophilum]|uniref:Zn(II)Cys6 transcriptional activator n=1 Tax=Fusarium pseudoanthophilum TaxID=48495 RepID=A0A8H5KEF7_9HYPO|nr:Zn(II)Cys6 transcriptional activator [Fusarium pseudoanthophilum]
MLDFTCQDFDVTSEEDAATQHEAKRYSEGGYSESDWEDFFRRNFFDPLVQTASGSPKDSRSDADALWETFNGKGDEVDDSTVHRFETVKCPKPDYAFYLPMYHLNTNFHIPGITDHRAREWHKASTPSLVESFSWATLKMLYENGLRPTPFRVFNKEPREKDLKCYPWLLVEYKKEKYTFFDRQQLEETVCCQAANGSASAIKLNQIAARYTIELPDEAHVPPIPVVTTVGPKVKVWITYLAKDCMVLYGGKYSWSSRWEKRSQAYWRFVHSTGGLRPTSATTALTRRQEAMELSRSALPLVQGVLDRQSSFELDDSLHHRLTPMLIGVLVQQICVAERQTLTQEMDRIVAEKVRALTLNAGTSSCSCRSNIRTNTTDEQTQEPSQATSVNVEDPKDDDYVDSQSRRSGSNDPTPSTPTEGLRRSTRLNPQVPSPHPSTPTGHIPRTPDAGSTVGKAPLAFSLFKAPESQGSYSKPVVESELESDLEWRTTSGHEPTNSLDGDVTPLPSPSTASSIIFTPTDDGSTQVPGPSLSPEGPAIGLRLADPSPAPVPNSDVFQPISRDILTIHEGPFFLEQQKRFTAAGTFGSLIEHYETTIHHWLPMLSIKRLKQDAEAVANSNRGVVGVLVFLALETLISQSDEHTILPQSNPLYLKAKHGSFIAESGGTINIRLVQTLTLLALYEFGHRIYPAAYLTIGQAVRLATMVGLHSPKDAKQLFVEPETWTLCEEQRRTWVVVAGSPQLLMAAPDPSTNDLLPCNDNDWTNGRIGFNEALFTRNFHSPSSVGQFARVCQAVHMFGKVLRHIKAREKDTDPVELTAEALQLHIVLVALDQGIINNDFDIMTAHRSLHSALSLCSLARLLLYNEYACNEPSFNTTRERLATEVEMQQISLDERADRSSNSSMLFFCLSAMALHSRSARSAYPEVYSQLKPGFRSARPNGDIPARPSMSSSTLWPFRSSIQFDLLINMSRLVWLVTGCSSGFGSEFVHQILSRGDKVIATARNSARIKSLASQGAAVLELDVTDSQDSIDQIISNAIAIYGRIDVLVNNAGFVAAGSWEDLSYNEFVSSFETNVFGPIKVTRAVLPHMRARKSGTMVFISSLSGWIGHQFTGAYAGSKFALEGVVESLHNETKSLGLRTLLMEPGRFRTPLLSTGHLLPKQSQIPDYESASETYHNHLHGGDLKQPGNPERFVKIVLDLVRQEGCAQGRTIPFRLPVGKDAVEEIEAKARGILETMQEWDSIITETDY